MTSTAHLNNQQLKKRNKWMFKLHVLTNELLDWASRVYSMYSKGQAHKPEYLEQIFIQLNADMIGHLRKKLEAEGYSVWNAITYRHHQQFVDDLAFNNRKMKEDIAFREQESDAKQTQINNLLTQLKEEQRLRVREVSQTKGELESQVEALKDDVARLKKEKDGLLNRYIIETNTTQRYSNKVEKLENEVEELGSNLEVVMNRYPPVSSRSREAVTREMLLETRIARLQKENDTLLNRLTEAETKNIRNGFPELEPYVDMKEEQGPLFPQRLNSLYVDDWTNAYEVVKNVYGERKSIVVLLEWLETCQKMGRDLFDEQKEMLKCETVGFLRKYQKNERKDLALPVSKNGVVHIKDFQRKMAADTIPAFKEVCRLNTIKSIRFKGRNAALDYINKCAELCWMMNFEDPPVGMDFEFKEGGKINPNRFTTYFKKGKLIDYLVWPVLMSLSDNTLLTKGIVQSK